MSTKLLYIIFLTTISSVVFACDCIPGKSITDDFNSADLVFEGKVVKIDTVFISDTVRIIPAINSKPHIQVVLRKFLSIQLSITRLFKGATKNLIVTIMTDAVGTRCGFHFVSNVDYLVYGNTGVFTMIDSGDIVKNKNNEKIKTTNIACYFTNSCTRTTMGVKNEISELKRNKLTK